MKLKNITKRYRTRFHLIKLIVGDSYNRIANPSPAHNVNSSSMKYSVALGLTFYLNDAMSRFNSKTLANSRNKAIATTTKISDDRDSLAVPNTVWLLSTGNNSE